MRDLSATLADRKRVAALREAGLLTDSPEEAYDRFTRLAATIVDAPIALFTVIVGDEQQFRSQYGLDEPLAAERREHARLGGGEEKIARQHEAGKLTARERIALLIDAGTFTELGIHAGIHHSVRGLEDKEAPADGVITGYGRVDGRMVAVAAY